MHKGGIFAGHYGIMLKAYQRSWYGAKASVKTKNSSNMIYEFPYQDCDQT